MADKRPIRVTCLMVGAFLGSQAIPPLIEAQTPGKESKVSVAQHWSFRPRARSFCPGREERKQILKIIRDGIARRPRIPSRK